jgi:hypothetical protein
VDEISRVSVAVGREGKVCFLSSAHMPYPAFLESEVYTEPLAFLFLNIRLFALLPFCYCYVLTFKKVAERGVLMDAEGSWKELIDSTNNLIADTIRPTVETSRVIEAVVKGLLIFDIC